MYDITKTRMLLTTAVFAAVAALIASGANARIPDEDGSGFEGQLSIVGVAAAQPPSWRGKGGKGEETGARRTPYSSGVARRDDQRDPAIRTAIQQPTRPRQRRRPSGSTREWAALQRTASLPATAAFPRRRATSRNEPGADPKGPPHFACRLRPDSLGGADADLEAGPGISFEDRGTHELHGVPGEWHLDAARDTA